jgi:hypothetical protein
MNSVQAQELKVLGMCPYEYVHYRSSEGREFLSLGHESGFLSYNENIELTQNEILELAVRGIAFINELRATFSHSKKQFLFHSGQRNIVNFDQWASVKSALKSWHSM